MKIQKISLVLTIPSRQSERMLPKQRSHWAPTLALAFAALLWGGSYVSARDLALSIGVIAALAGRFAFAAIALWVIQALRARPPKVTGTVITPGLILGVLRAATLALETYGVTQTSPTNAGVLIGVSVVLTPLLESVARRRRPQQSVLLSAALATIGIGVLAAGNSGFAQFGVGDLLILCAAVTRAVLVLVGSLLDVERTDSFTVTAIEVTVGAGIYGALGGVELFGHFRSMGSMDWVNLLYLALGCTVASFILQLWGTARTSASHASVVLGTEPVWALMFGIAIAGDRLTWASLFGAVAIIGAAIWSQRATSRHAEVIHAEGLISTNMSLSRTEPGKAGARLRLRHERTDDF